MLDCYSGRFDRLVRWLACNNADRWRQWNGDETVTYQSISTQFRIHISSVKHNSPKLRLCLIQYRMALNVA